MSLLYLPKQEAYVPCGRCAFCLATKRSDWVMRLYHEHKAAEDSCFLTLTYANPHLTWKHGRPQLVKADLQDYIRAIRRRGYKIRYYAVGEYGSQTYRPHYHVLLFGSVPEEVLRKTWTMGTIHVGKITLASCGYCTKYVINSKANFMKHKRDPPFAIMSLKPAIGHQYLTKAMIAWHKEDRRNYIVHEGTKRHLPRYYKDKIFSKIDKVRISNRAQRDGLESLRAELLELSKYHDNAMEYRDEMRRELAKRIKDKTKQHLTI